MNDRPSFADEYQHAVVSGNLRMVDHKIGDPERLMALAMTDKRLASPSYRAITANDPASIRELIALWRADVTRVARIRHWRIKMLVQVEEAHIEMCEVLLPVKFLWAVADASIHSWLFDVCPACTGRKFALTRPVGDEDWSRSTLSDTACVACNGTGKSTPDIERRELLPFVEEAIAMLRSRFEATGKKARARLRSK